MDPCASKGSPGGSISISADGSKPGMGIVWGTITNGASADHGNTGGAIYAYNAETLRAALEFAAKREARPVGDADEVRRSHRGERQGLYSDFRQCRECLWPLSPIDLSRQFARRFRDTVFPWLAARDTLAHFARRHQIEIVRKIEPFDSVPHMQRRLQFTTPRRPQAGRIRAAFR